MPAEMTWFVTAFRTIVYLAMLGLVTIAAYGLWAGPEQFGFTESWPLVAFFVVPYLGTLLIVYGIIAVFGACARILDEDVI
jgi:hypothetical protein